MGPHCWRDSLASWLTPAPGHLYPQLTPDLTALEVSETRGGWLGPLYSPLTACRQSINVQIGKGVVTPHPQGLPLGMSSLFSSKLTKGTRAGMGRGAHSLAYHYIVCTCATLGSPCAFSGANFLARGGFGERPGQPGAADRGAALMPPPPHSLSQPPTARFLSQCSSKSPRKG